MKEKNSDNITLTEAKSALLRSGYLLEGRVEQLLLEKDYYVEANAVYPDPSTQKSREFDLQASKSHALEGKFGNWVKSNLVIECVNNPQPIAFITKKAPSPERLSENIKFNGVPTSIRDTKLLTFSNRSKDDLRLSTDDFLEMSTYHHYCSGKVATQFCSFTKKKNQDEWMASHDDTHFESFQKLCDVIDYFLTKTKDDWSFSSLRAVSLQFFYPLIVVQGELLEVRVNKKRGLAFQKAKHIQFTRTTIQKTEPTTYQIDIVAESYLPEYLKIIDEEMLETIKRIKNNIDAMNIAIEENIKASLPIAFI